MKAAESPSPTEEVFRFCCRYCGLGADALPRIIELQEKFVF